MDYNAIRVFHPLVIPIEELLDCDKIEFIKPSAETILMVSRKREKKEREVSERKDA